MFWFKAALEYLGYGAVLSVSSHRHLRAGSAMETHRDYIDPDEGREIDYDSALVEPFYATRSPARTAESRPKNATRQSGTLKFW